MNSDDAIKLLTNLKQNKEKSEEHKETKNHAMGMMGLKDILTHTMCELCKLIMANQYAVTVKNFPKTTKLEKELIKMNLTLDKIALTLESLSTGQMVRSLNLKKPATEPVK